jgi:hypothetical protein
MTVTARELDQAKEAVSRCLVRELIVPHVYWDAPWPDVTSRADIVAVDRAGGGDLHVVRIEAAAADALAYLPELMAVPAQYRWVAFFTETLDPLAQLELIGQAPLYPPNGPGRVGVIEVVRMADDLGANIRLKAQRFPTQIHKAIEKFTSQHEPTISIR